MCSSGLLPCSHCILCGLNGRYCGAIFLKSLYGHPCAVFCSSWKSRVTSFNPCGICPNIVSTSGSIQETVHVFRFLLPQKCLLNYFYIIMCMCCSQEVQNCRVHRQLMLSVQLMSLFCHKQDVTKGRQQQEPYIWREDYIH